MDGNNYVGQNGSGYIVVIGGKIQGTYPTQAAAEQAYNSATGQSTGSTPPPTGDQTLYDTPNGKKTLQQMIDGLHGAGWNGDYTDPASVIAAYNATAAGTGATPTTGTGSAAQNLLDAIASGDQTRFDEAVKEFNQNFQENQRQFNQSQYTDLAKTLLSTGADLSSHPADYFQFNKYTSGGRDLFQQLFGNQPRADFSAPTGQLQAGSIGDLMTKLGFTTVPGSPPSPTSTGTTGTYNTINGNKTLDQMKAELKTAGWTGDPNDTNAVIAAYASTTKGAVTPVTTTTTGSTPTSPTVSPNVVTPNVATTGVNAGVHPTATAPTPTTPLSGVAASVGATPAPTATPTPSTSFQTPSATPTPAPAPTPTSTGFPTPTPQTGTAFNNQPTAPGAGAFSTAAPSGVTQGWTKPVPLPYQINPAVWDSMGSVGQQLALSAAAAAGWDKDEYLRQINAARPQGTAPGASSTAFRTPMGAFS